MKILNLYACLGGNRYKWNEVKEGIEVTAVEWDEELARLYQERFPNDKVIVADAHQYLLDHYKEFDFIWSSPPCPTHSRFQISMKTKRKMKYPDMKLYKEIIFLDTFFICKYCVENVIPYYEPLIPAKKRDRHLYWTNFNLPNVLSERKSPNMAAQKEGRELYKKLNKKVFDVFCEYHDYDFKKYKGKQDVGKMSRNLLDYEAVRTIIQTPVGIIKKQDINQTELF
jgi:DNA (cytosine-5)-methyltransferase 1